MPRKYRNLGGLELEVLKVLWERGDGSVFQVAEVLSKGKGYARTTILTVMQRLHKKGYLKRKKVDNVYQYTPTKKRKQVMGSLLADFVRHVFDGSSSNLVQHLTEASVTQEELDKIQHIIAEARVGGDG